MSVDDNVCDIFRAQPLKRQSQLQQANNFVTSFKNFEKIRYGIS